MKIDFTRKNVLVTGSSGVIGRAICLAFSKANLNEDNTNIINVSDYMIKYNINKKIEKFIRNEDFIIEMNRLPQSNDNSGLDTKPSPSTEQNVIYSELLLEKEKQLTHCRDQKSTLLKLYSETKDEIWREELIETSKMIKKLEYIRVIKEKDIVEKDETIR